MEVCIACHQDNQILTRYSAVIPLVPLAAAVVAALSPPSAVTNGFYPSIVSYDTLRASFFVGAFYLSALATIILLSLQFSKSTALVGLASSFLFVNLVYLWTAARLTSMQWLVWAAWSPSNGIGYYMLDWLTVGMVCLAGLIAFLVWRGTGSIRASLRALEVGSLAVLPLPVYVLAFDYGEFYLHVANVGPAWLTNQDLLLGITLLLSLLVAADLLLKRASSAGWVDHVTPGRQG